MRSPCHLTTPFSLPCESGHAASRCHDGFGLPRRCGRLEAAYAACRHSEPSGTRSRICRPPERSSIGAGCCRMQASLHSPHGRARHAGPPLDRDCDPRCRSGKAGGRLWTRHSRAPTLQGRVQTRRRRRRSQGANECPAGTTSSPGPVFATIGPHDAEEAGAKYAPPDNRLHGSEQN